MIRWPPVKSPLLIEAFDLSAVNIVSSTPFALTVPGGQSGGTEEKLAAMLP